MRKYRVGTYALLAGTCAAFWGAVPDATWAQEPPASPPYEVRVADAVRLAESSPEQALEQLAEAAALRPERPDAHYYRGSLQRRAGDLDAAIESFERCGSGTDPADAMLRAHCLAAIATTLEWQASREEGVPEARLQRARAAWTRYAEAARGLSTGASPELARARIEAIDRVLAQERAYAAVRERAAARSAAH